MIMDHRTDLPLLQSLVIQEGQFYNPLSVTIESEYSSCG